ncbi:MAG: hypothetical protein IIT41_04375, partial [Oscillospiraceae bacterium]|nr:hypothetical protein [Oscillospiraceae bacterium]
MAAPTGMNVQPWRFVVVRDQAVKDVLAGPRGGMIAQAPVVFVICGETTLMRKPFGQPDAEPVEVANGTQSNSVCFAYDGQAIGVGAGQQSRIHCTRLAGSKADTWFLRQSPKVMSLKFKPGLGRADRDNAIDGYINRNEEDVTADGVWQRFFAERPEPYTDAEQRAYLDTITGVSLGSDAFFPFGDNIQRAAKSGVKYVAEPGGSVRDDNVIETADSYGMAMAFTGMRLFHH